MNLRDAFKKALSENGGVLPVNGKKISKPANKAQTSIHPKKTSASKVIAMKLESDKNPSSSVQLSLNAKCLVKFSSNSIKPLKIIDSKLGSMISINEIENPEIHELALGLDFGTSSVKVVIGDLASDKAYAVPFLEASGIEAFLMPSRVFESVNSESIEDQIFSLTNGVTAYRDLKLSLLANPHSVEHQLAVIAFLSLVIARARAWFFQKHKTIYKRVKCLWQLRVGLPSTTAVGNKYASLFEKIVRAAWKVSTYECVPTRKLVLKIHGEIFNMETFNDELDVRVIPEIAAQIFGFVASSSFDKKAKNRYLMVDVGAGTVDSSLFKVTSGKGGKWNFEFYTAVVQPYGVSNLHSYRVEWWQSQLSKIAKSNLLLNELQKTKYATDLEQNIPIYNRDYFDGVHFEKDHPDTVDSSFFEKKLLAQIQGSTLWRANKDGFLATDQLKNTPMFLCGGGSRSPFYLELENKLQNLSGYSWLSTEPWQLAFPNDLSAEDVDEVDFDRLSVAYGLSKVDVGEVTQALPLPKVINNQQQSFSSRYVDKDLT